MTDFLLKGATVLTLGSRTQNHSRADVLIESGLVSEVGGGLRSRSATLIDATNTIVMPGFVDAHRRCWLSLFKNEGVAPTDTTPLPDDVYAGSLASLLGAAESGITTVVDWYDGPSELAHVEAVLRAHADSGLRTVLALAPKREAPAFWREAVAAWGATPTESVTLAAGVSTMSGGAGTFLTARRMAAELGLRIHVRGGQPEAGKLASASDALGGDITVVHCNGLDDADLDAISSAGAGVALTPVGDMTNGPGVPPMQAILDRGIRPGLGVGDELQGPGDLLAQIRAAISIQHATYFDLKLAGKGGLPNLLTTRDVIRHGTSDGAAAIGLDGDTGSIEVGKRADLIVLRTDTPNLYPVNDPIGAVVWGVDTSNLDWVFVGGRPVMREGVLQVDVATIGSLVTDARRRMGAPTRFATEALAGGDA